MATALEVVESALRAIAVASRGYTLDAEDANDGLKALQAMLYGWNAEGLPIPKRTWSSFALTIGKDTYTWGTGGDFNDTRPQRVEQSFVRDANEVDTPVTILGAHQWARIAAKNVDGRPTRVYIEYDDPLSTAYFDFEADQAYTWHVLWMKPIVPPASLSADDGLPDEYDEALKWNLALRLAPEYGRQAPPEVVAMARESKNRILANNLARRMVSASVDSALVRESRFNIYSADY